MSATAAAPALAKYEMVVGLEVHVQLRTRTKLFCNCSTQFGDPPNRNTCPVCLALPGSLPVLNESAVELATRAALALDATVQEESVFARKNYFYPDLPKGYQISQFDQPLAIDGQLVIGEHHDGSRMLLAALCAKGTSAINNAGQIERGYERIDERLNALGAQITRVDERRK